MSGNTPSLRDRLMAAQSGCCFHCGGLMTTEDVNAPTFATFEHIVPRAVGGKNHRNRVLAHRHCNMLRSIKKLRKSEKRRARKLIDLVCEATA